MKVLKGVMSACNMCVERWAGKGREGNRGSKHIFLPSQPVFQPLSHCLHCLSSVAQPPASKPCPQSSVSCSLSVLSLSLEEKMRSEETENEGHGNALPAHAKGRRWGKQRKMQKVSRRSVCPCQVIACEGEAWSGGGMASPGRPHSHATPEHVLS